MFYCAISGEPPQDPVISSKSGHVYERSLILKYLNENGSDPVTGEKLEESDLVGVKTNPKSNPPRPPALTSIPALLHSLQNEWDSLVLETFALRQQYNATRQELSHALYQQDAATRVVARVIKERDAAREALANVQATLGQGQGETTDIEMPEAGADSAEPSNVLPDETVEKIDSLFKQLVSTRKKRKVAAEYTTPAQISTFEKQQEFKSLHKSSAINTFALSRANQSHFLTGGNDKVVQLYDSAASNVIASLTGHTKKVTQVLFREDDRGDVAPLVISTSADKTARIWSLDESSKEYSPQRTIKTHKGESAAGLLPAKTLLALASADKSYSIHDLTSSQTLYQSPNTDKVFTSLAAHPDGTLLALGTADTAVQFYDVRTGKVVADLSIPDASSYSIPTLSFSENGYHLCAPSSASCLQIWDLRKLTSVANIDLGGTFKINRVRHDFGSGLLIGAAGNEGVRVYRHKTWEEVVRLPGPETGEAMDLDWSLDGRRLWVTGGREVVSFGLPAVS